MQRTDVEYAVLGAGIMGVSAAFYLNELGHDVMLIDRKAVGEEASGRNAGSLSLQNKPYPIIPLCKGGIRTWKELETEIGGLGFKQSGGFRVAETPEQASFLDEDLAERNRYGLDVERVPADQVCEMAPYLSTHLTAVNYCAWDSYADARVATQRIALAASDRGVHVVTHSPVIDLTPLDTHRIAIQTAAAEYICRKLLVASGIWTKGIAEWLDVSLPINMRINQMIVTPRLPRIISHMITHASGNLTLKQVDCGSVLIGGGWPGDGDLERDIKLPRYDSVVGNASVAVRVVPALADVEAVRTWAGLDGRTEDQLPILGPLPGNANVFLASSCFGGYVAGPYIGKLMAQKMSSGCAEIDLAPFSPGRYSTEGSPQGGEANCRRSSTY